MTNELPIPYIVYKGESITPIYGGEEYGSALYSIEGIPLPSIILTENIWRKLKRSIYDFLYAEEDNIVIKTKKIIKSFLSKQKTFYFRNTLIYKLKKTGELYGENYYFIHKRKFNFLDKVVIVEEYIFVKRNITFEKFTYFVLFSLGNILYKSENKFIFDIKRVRLIIKSNNLFFKLEKENFFCAIGKLHKLYARINSGKMKKGESINFSYVIEFYR